MCRFQIFGRGGGRQAREGERHAAFFRAGVGSS